MKREQQDRTDVIVERLPGALTLVDDPPAALGVGGRMVADVVVTESPTPTVRRLEAPLLVEATILVSDIRGYTSIAERIDPVALAIQLNDHRVAMGGVIVNAGGAVMQYVGDSVMAVFGALRPLPDHARAAVASADAMHQVQAGLNAAWEGVGRPPFGIGIGISTGRVAAAHLGDTDCGEVTVVGDVVNLAERIQHWATLGETILSEATIVALPRPLAADRLEPTYVRGREAAVIAFRRRRTVASPHVPSIGSSPAKLSQ